MAEGEGETGVDEEVGAEGQQSEQDCLYRTLEHVVRLEIVVAIYPYWNAEKHNCVSCN